MTRLMAYEYVGTYGLDLPYIMQNEAWKWVSTTLLTGEQYIDEYGDRCMVPPAQAQKNDKFS